MKLLRILIADDHDIVRAGTQMLIEGEPGWSVCAVAKTGREALEQAKQHRPDVVVLDITMPELNGVEATRLIKNALPRTEVLVFTAHETDEIIRRAFEAGAKSYILKSEATEYLLAAIKSLAQHEPFFTSKVSEVLFEKFLNPSAHTGDAAQDDPLTTREQEIVRLLAEGKSNKEVAHVLQISVRTAETHRAAIMRKPGIDSLAGLVRYAIRSRIIEA
jgi:DNA-binding NarL/FixJ family response regulator